MVVQPEALIPFQQRLNLKALLHASALETYALGDTIRFHGSEENSLHVCLCIILKHVWIYTIGSFTGPCELLLLKL
eukprot:c27162_g2_i1 orf=596-823(+)